MQPIAVWVAIPRGLEEPPGPVNSSVRLARTCRSEAGFKNLVTGGRSNGPRRRGHSVFRIGLRGEPMKPFNLPKRDALPANEEQMPRTAEKPAANDLRSYLQRSGLGNQAPGKEPERNGSAPAKHANGSAAAAHALNSLDAVLDHLQLLAEQDAPRAVLVMAAGPELSLIHI